MVGDFLFSPLEYGEESSFIKNSFKKTPLYEILTYRKLFLPMPRILLKISGEVLSSSTQAIERTKLQFLFNEISSIQKEGIELGIVIGGGNFWRGRAMNETGISRGVSDRIGMLATILNALAIADFFREKGLSTSVFSALGIQNVCEEYSREKAITALQNGDIVFFPGGTGNPFFTTDSAAALRAADLGCDRLLKATTVDGVYTEDPKKNPQAIKYPTLSFSEALEKRLEVMDITAFSLCKDFQIPITVFDGSTPGNMIRAAKGESIGTLIS